MNIFSIFNCYAPLFSDVYEVLSCLGEEGGVGDFFGVVVPVPDFESVVGGVGDYGFAFECWVVAEEYGLFGVEFGYLEVVDLCDFEEGGGEFCFCHESGLVDVLACGF